MIRSYEIISSRTIHISFVDAVIHPLVQSRLEALNLSSLIVVPALRFDIQRLVTANEGGEVSKRIKFGREELEKILT